MMTSASHTSQKKTAWRHKLMKGKPTFLVDLGWAAVLFLILISLPWTVCQASYWTYGSIAIAIIMITITFLLAKWWLEQGKGDTHGIFSHEMSRKFIFFGVLLLSITILANILNEPSAYNIPWLGSDATIAANKCQINAWRFIFGDVTLILTSLTLIAGVVWEDIRSNEERENEHRHALEDAQHAIAQFENLSLQENYSALLRLYRECKDSDEEIWQDRVLSQQLTDAWNRWAPLELQMIKQLLAEKALRHHPGLVEAQRQPNSSKTDESQLSGSTAGEDPNEAVVPKNFARPSTIVDTLRWGWKTLDRDFQSKLDKIWAALPPEEQREIEKQLIPAKELWGRSIDTLLPGESSVEKWQDGNQFAFDAAEKDKALLQFPSKFSSILIEQLISPKPTFIMGTHGSGKTAVAFLFTWEHLNAPRPIFPVYWRLPATQLCEMKLNDILQKIAYATLTYCAIRPIDYIQLDTSEKARMAYLWGYHCITEPALQLFKRGLRKYGPGRILLEQVEELLHKTTFKESINDVELLSDTAKALPLNFERITIIIDLQDVPGGGRAILTEQLPKVQKLIHLLAAYQIFVKVFVPDELGGKLTTAALTTGVIDTITISWSLENLKDMITRRLKVGGTQITTLNSWCNADVNRIIDLDECVVACAKGSPTKLLQLCSELWQCHHNGGRHLLSMREIKDTLGHECHATCFKSDNLQGKNDE